MKTTPRFTEFLRKQQSLLAVAVLAVVSAIPAFGTSIYWDGTGTAWGTMSGWSTASGADLPDPALAPGAVDDVVFNISTLNTNQSVGFGGANQSGLSLTFNSTGTVVLGNGGGNRDLTVGSGGIVVASGAGAVTIGSSGSGSNVFVRLGESQTWANHSTSGLTSRNQTTGLATGTAPVTLTLRATNSGAISNSGALNDGTAGAVVSLVVDSSGSGNSSLSGGNFSGGTTIKSGLLSTSGSLGSGGVALAEAAGTNDVRLHASGVVANNITVQSGTGLRALTGGTGGDYQGNIVLNRDVTFGSVSSSSQTVIFSGDISGNFNVTAARVATGTSNPIVTLSGDNTYTGKTTIESATLVVGSLNKVTGGSASSNMGAPTTVENGKITLSAVAASTLRYTGTGETTDRVIELVNNLGATLNQSGTGILNLAGNIAMTGTGNRTLTLRGASEGTGEISGIIQNVGGGINTSITKLDAGTWRLSNVANTYAGSTSFGATGVIGGVIEVAKLADGGVPSSIGASSNTNTNLIFGGATTPGTLRYIGTGDSTNRRFQIGGIGANIESSGAGALNFTDVGSLTFTTGTSPGTLILGGTNTGSNTFACVIPNPSSNVTSLTKSGTGKWILTGNNTYTGNTTVTDGTLGITVDDLGDTGTVEIGSSGILNLDRVSTDTVNAFYINGIQQVMGEWGSLASDAPNKTARITGTGKLQVTTGPVASDPYLAWMDTFTSITVPADKEKAADPDRDGLTNAAEFALDGNPASGAATGRVRSQVETVGAEQALVITLPVRAGAVFDNTPGPAADATIDNLTYTIQGTNNLTVFDQGVTEISVSSGGMPALSGASWTYRTFRLNGPVGGVTPRGPNGFLRVMVMSAP